MHWFQIAGIFLEGLGVAVALSGLRSRFREFAQPGQGAFDPAIERIRRVGNGLKARTQAQLARFLRRPAKVISGSGAAHVAGGGSVRARGRVGWGPIPRGRSNKPALDELDRRTRELLDRLYNVRDTLESDTKRVDDAAGALREHTDAEIMRLDDRIRRLATGDVTLQYVGLAMIVLGLLLQALGAVIERPA